MDTGLTPSYEKTENAQSLQWNMKFINAEIFLKHRRITVTHSYEEFFWFTKLLYAWPLISRNCIIAKSKDTDQGISHTESAQAASIQITKALLPEEVNPDPPDTNLPPSMKGK